MAMMNAPLIVQQMFKDREEKKNHMQTPIGKEDKKDEVWIFVGKN